MSIEISTGEPSPSRKPVKTAKPARVPVAKPATRVPRIKGGPEPEKADLVEDLLSPPSIKGFAWSIGGHVLLLLILAFWYFAPPSSPPRVIDTRLAGSEFGDPNGDQLKGGLGMDEASALPDAPAGPSVPEQERTITALPVADLAAAATKALAAADKSSGGGGSGLTSPRQAGNGDGFGVAKFGSGGENINGVDVKVGDPQFTLIWDTVADIDLHVIEPRGSEIYWESRNGNQGGELDVDDVDGFGPENVNYENNKGPRGTYTWFVHYYGGDFGKFHPTRWKVRVKHGGRVDLYQGRFNAIHDKSQVFTLKLGDPSAPVDPKDTSAGTKITAPAAPPPTATTPAPIPMAPAPSVAAGPRPFAPAGGGFSATLPGEPRAGRKDLETSAGAVVAQTYGIEGGEGGLTIATADFPASALAKADPGKLLDDLADKLVADSKGTSPRRTKIALSGSAGREVEFTLPESVVAGGGSGRARVYLAGSRAFLLSAVGTKSYVDGPEAAALFNTFQMTDAK